MDPVAPPVVSICIPVYNGVRSLRQTVESIASQWQPGLEVVLRDDCSTDSSWQLSQELAREYPFVKVFRNEKNLGMDGNFIQAALSARSEFTWLSGQDDLFVSGVVPKVLGILEKNPKLGVVYLNYGQFDDSLEKVVCASILHEKLRPGASFEVGQDIIFRSPRTAEGYFGQFEAVPSFLPATIMHRDFWTRRDLTPYFGTHYIQVAAICLNMKTRDFHVVTEPLIKGRIPADGWQSRGPFYFSVMVGSFAAEAMIHADPENPFPEELYQQRKRRFRRSYYALVRHSKRFGMRPNRRHVRHLKAIFGYGPVFFFFTLPVLFTPLKILDLSHAAYRRLFKRR